jgi:hypothetical protein
MPVINPLVLYRGQDATLEFTENAASGDISAWTIVFTLSARRNSATKIGAPIAASIVNGATGRYNIVLPAALLDRAPATLFYDVWRTDAGEAVPLSIGTLEIRADSYRPAAS